MTISEATVAVLDRQAIEVPSWAYGNSGTRFTVFAQAGVPRDPFEKLPDAAQVNAFTGLAPTVALHIPWDEVDDFAKLREHAESLGVGLGTINSNKYQDDIYKLGSLAHADASVRVIDGSGIGTLEVRGPSVMREYWSRPEATAEAFHDGWFVTGDRVSVDDDGLHRIVGRDSVDIIKTGGEKVSALEIEDVLRQHDDIEDVAVVGVADPEWGERVVACVVWAGVPLDIESLRDWARRRLASYKLPSKIVNLEALPRNAMGKTVKTDLRRALTADGSEPTGRP